MTFTPWSSSLATTALPASAITLINQVAAQELSENFTAQTNLPTMYFSGKGLAKFAAILIATNDMASNPGLAAAGLISLKSSFETFVLNTQETPLVYDTVWRGAVSGAGYTDPNADFGGKLTVSAQVHVTHQL